MSVPTSSVPKRTEEIEPHNNTFRRLVNYQPSLWGDHFLSLPPHHDLLRGDGGKGQQHEDLKEEVRSVLKGVDDKTANKLKMIDEIQRLGVAYHFESEIEDELLKIYKEFDDRDEDLHAMALRFRLLRQQGYNVSCEIFKKFKDEKGNFKKSLISDVHGMLSLYEATHLRIEGEQTLEDAFAFTTTHLHSMVNLLSTSSPLVKQLKHALNRPIRKGLPRLEARHYLSLYQEDCSCSEILLTFAKLDFNLVQEQHQKELREVTRWWKDFKLKVPYARDRIVECYFWIMGVYFEPKFSIPRKLVTKVISMTSLIDDTYDVYGTFEELTLFTQAIQRWDLKCLNSFPPYMRVIYKVLLDVYNEIEEVTTKEGRPYCVHYAKEAMKRLCRAYYVEAEWTEKGHVPSMEEYMENALISSGYPMLATTVLFGMGELATKEAFDWVFHDPPAVRAASVVARLMDDIVSHKLEQEREHIPSAVEFYMEKHSVSEVIACRALKEQVLSAWRDINKQCLEPTAVPLPILSCILNLMRVMDVMYKDGDGYTNADIIKDYVASLLIHPVIEN